jgi:type IV pilus assembly protein PilB
VLGTPGKKTLEELDFCPLDLRRVSTALAAPHGLILVTGPTGSGKSTTLYTMIRSIATPDVNVLTVEDPVEAELPGVTQVAVRPDIGVTFEAALRAFLRQDPDIMLVGEIRDGETAEIAVKAAITGHLVLSTLHTRGAPSTAMRLVHMGVPAYLVAACLELVIAQRLVRRLCPACRQRGPASETDLRPLSDEERARYAEVWAAPGCDECRGTGCVGRRALFEVMPVTNGVKKLLLAGATPDQIGALAESEGMVTLRRAALALVEAGEIGLAEVAEVCLGE